MKYTFKVRYNTYRLFGYSFLVSLFLAITSNSNQHEIAMTRALDAIKDNE